MPDEKINRQLGFVSYDLYDYSREVAAEDKVEVIEENENEDQQGYSPDDMKQVMGFLLRIDDYSLQILSEIVKNSKTNDTMASDVARNFGVSRQAIHRKIRDSCVKYPELRGLFKLYLYRCKSIVNGRVNGRKNDKKEYNSREQELKFDA